MINPDAPDEARAVAWARFAWYPVSHLRRDGFPVFVLALDRQLVAYRKTLGRRTSWRVRDVANHTIDLPEAHWPSLWRPIDPVKFPDPLPERAILQPEPPAVRPRLADAPEPTDDYVWPGRYHEAPDIERREAEVRIIRASRTLEILVKADLRRRGGAADWLGQFAIEARLIELRLKASRDGKLPGLRTSDYDDFYIDRSALEARPARFVPTRIDLRDIDLGVLRWLTVLSKVERALLRWRGDLPPWSLRQIGEKLGVTKQRVHLIYERALDRLAAAANAPHTTNAAADAELIALRARNRAYRRGLAP